MKRRIASLELIPNLFFLSQSDTVVALSLR
jgi:hypothetical protein